MKAGKDFIGVGCGALIINDKNEILLVKRSWNSRVDRGLWSRPGGEVEFNESVETAVEREVKEEVGIVVKAVRRLDYTETISDDGTTHWIALGFLATYVSGEPTNVEPDKHDEIKWFPLDQIPDNTAEYTKNSIAFYLGTKKIEPWP